MPIWDNDGTVRTELAKAFDDDGTVRHQTGKAYTDNGTSRVLLYQSQKSLENSSLLKRGPAASNGAVSYASDVRWDCRGFDTLTFDLQWLCHTNGQDAQIRVMVRTGEYEYLPDVLDSRVYQESLATLKCTVDISGLTEDAKNGMFLNMYTYTYAPDWTNKYATIQAQAVNVLAL